MRLFELNDNNEVIIEPQAFLIAPFKTIHDRDKSPKKNISKKEIAFVWFFSDFKSDFNILEDEAIKIKEIKDALELPATWQPDNLIREAIDYYNRYSKTEATILLEKARNAVRKISTYLEDVDLTKIDKSGKLLHNPKIIADLIKVVPTLAESLIQAEQKVKEELDRLGGDMKGNKEKSTYDDGFEFDK